MTILSALSSAVSSTRRMFGMGLSGLLEDGSLSERIIFFLALGLTLFISLFPFYWMAITSFVPPEELYRLPPRLFPSEFTAQYYETILNPGQAFPFVQFFINSFLIATVSATLGVLFTIFGAYSFARLEYPGRGLISRGVLVLYMFAGILMVVPLFQILVFLGLVDSIWGLALVHFVFNIPLGLYLLGNFFRSIPKEIEEAAMIDGYSRLEVILRITVPMSSSAIIAVFLYSFIYSWNEYLYASIILRSTEIYTLPIGIEQLQYTFENVWGEIMAASIMATIPVLILFMYLQKYMVEGLSFGSMD
jgi:multiple sugar transport system permease protein